MRSLIPDEILKLDRTPRRVIYGIAVAGCLLRLFFWFYTGRVWEDALITVLHSENFANGLGLTHHHPGWPPVHGFTSPLSVLIPLVADIFHPGWGLALLKLVSALIAIPTVLLGAAVALNPAFRLNVWLVYLLASYLAFEHHQVLWGMAGMETQVAIFALFLVMYQALRLRSRALGIAMAVCIYARPDFAIFLLLVALYLFLTDRAVLRRSVLTALVLYAPWVLFTTLYYGSPVPNTIVAKGLGYPLWTKTTSLLSADAAAIVWARLYDYIYLPLGPSFAGHGSGFLKFADEGFISRGCVLLILAGALAMLRGFHRFYVIPLGSLAAYSAYYVFLVHGIFGWYLVPFSAVNCLLLVLALGALLRWLAPQREGRLCLVACALYILPFLAVLPINFRTERDIQHYLETPVRMAIGRYLFDHKRPGDRIGCEPLGYIAYYSRMPVYDYPGLASPEVTAFIKQYPERRFMRCVLAHFKPEWITLRQHEYREMVELDSMKFLATEYAIEKVFEINPDRARKIFRITQNIDQCFYLLKKRP